MKKLVVLMAVCLMATAAFASIDPDRNSMGVYYDEAATVTGGTPPFGFPITPYNLYIVVANPTFAECSGFECSITITGGGVHNIASVVYPTPGVNVGSITNQLTGYASPIPAQENLIVATLVMNSFANMPGEVFLGPATPSSAGMGVPEAIGDGVLVGLDVSSGDMALPVCRIFGDSIVAEELSSFGSVKSLFR